MEKVVFLNYVTRACPIFSSSSSGWACHFMEATCKNTAMLCPQNKHCSGIPRLDTLLVTEMHCSSRIGIVKVDLNTSYFVYIRQNCMINRPDNNILGADINLRILLKKDSLV